MTDWLVDAVMLPDGTAAESRWLTASGWTDQRVPDAVALPGHFALAGLVDAHSHVSFSDGDGDPVFIDANRAESHRERYARDGVAILRDAGGAPDVVLTLPRTAGRPFVIAAGRHLAPPGMYFEGVHLPVEAEDVVDVALGELIAGARWAKLVADFPSAAARAASPAAPPQQTYDVDVLRRLIDAVHGAGGRVAAHVTTPLASTLVSLGIDSIEHGTALDKATIDEMAARGTAWTPTLCAVLSAAADAPPERRRVVAERRERFGSLLPHAVARGVPVLTGSDVVGTIPREIALLVECGVAPADALRAATASAMTFLGAEAATAPPSVVTYDADPREDPEVLREPTAVVIGGVRVR